MFSGITIPSIMPLSHSGRMCNSALLEKMDPELSAGAIGNLGRQPEITDPSRRTRSLRSFVLARDDRGKKDSARLKPRHANSRGFRARRSRLNCQADAGALLSVE